MKLTIKEWTTIIEALENRAEKQAKNLSECSENNSLFPYLKNSYDSTMEILNKLKSEKIG